MEGYFLLFSASNEERKFSKYNDLRCEKRRGRGEASYT